MFAAREGHAGAVTTLVNANADLNRHDSVVSGP